MHRFDVMRTFLSPLMMFLALTLLISNPGSVIAEEPAWTQFRGPDGDGVVDTDLDLTVIGDPEKLLWSTPVRGVGWSSTVTDGKQLWLSTSITTEATEAERQAALAKVLIPQIKDVAGSVELLAVSIDAASGETLWERSLDKIDDPSPIHPMNSYASPTPLVADGKVVFHFGGYGTWCLNGATGETIWTQKLVVDDSVGPGSSPVRHGDRMLVACDGIDRQFVAALSLDDGKIAWKTPRPPMRATNPEFQKAYSTPLLIEVDGQTQAVVPGAQWLVAYDPATGEELWRADCGNGFSVATMPIFTNGLVFFSTGYTSPELVAVDPTGTGDVTATHIRWRQSKGVPTKPSFVCDADYLYVISDDGILMACSLENGETIWRKRIGGTFSSSPIRSGNQVFIANHAGELTVFEIGDKCKLLRQIETDDQVMASPMPIGEDVILRTKAAVARYHTEP